MKGGSKVSIAAVIEVLSQMTELYEELLQLSLKKRDIIIRNKVIELSSITKQESSIIELINDLEQKRITAVCDCMTARSCQPDPNIKLSDLVMLVKNPEEKIQLLEIQKGLVSKLEQLNEMNLANKLLVDESLDFIDYTMDLLLDSSEQDLIYMNPSQQQGKARNSVMFDSRI